MFDSICEATRGYEVKAFDDRRFVGHIFRSSKFTGYTLLSRKTLQNDTFCRHRVAVGEDSVGEGVGGGN